MISNLISGNQNAFIKGRHIVDVSLIANECLDYYLRKRKAGLIFTFDLEKAFHFLLEVMTCALLGIGGYSGSSLASLLSDFKFTLMEALKASLSLKEP